MRFVVYVSSAFVSALVTVLRGIRQDLDDQSDVFGRSVGRNILYAKMSNPPFFFSSIWLEHLGIFIAEPS